METALYRSPRTALLARQTTLISAVFLAIAAMGIGLLARSRHDASQWMYFAHMTVAAAVAGLLWRRPKATEGWSLVAFLAIALPLLPIFWVAQVASIEEGPLWQPFIGRKLIILGLALLTPWSRRATLALLAAFMTEGLVIWIHLDLSENPIATAGGEPWITLLYFGAAIALALLRWRSRRLEELRRRAELEAEMLCELRRVAVVVHDRVNTPLQSISIGLALLDEHHPDDRSLLERMGRSLRSLVELTQSLRAIEVTGLRAAQVEGARLEHLDHLAPPC